MAKKVTKSTTDERVFAQNAFKTLATNIRFASVDSPVSVIAVTSSVANEGKSTISVGLAQALGQGGKHILLIECDMRRRSLAAMLNVHSRQGIYSVLSGQAKLEDVVVSTKAPGVSFLDCEPHIPNPVDILGSKRFRNFVEGLKSQYDNIILDCPPLGAFVDAAVASESADGTVLVCRQDFVKREEFLNAYDQLKKANANVLGVVMNYCEDDKSDYYYSYYNKPKNTTVSTLVGTGAGSAPASMQAPVAPPSTPTPAPQPPVQRKPTKVVSTPTVNKVGTASAVKPITHQVQSNQSRFKR